MNCTNWEERIALYTGGDLPVAESAEVERHLTDCPACQMFASGLRESLEFLRDADRDEIAPVHFAALRARVLSQLENAGRPWWQQGWVYALSGAMAVLVLMLALRPAPPSHPRQAARTQAPPPVVEVPAPVSAPPAAQVRRVATRRRIRPAAPRRDPGPPIVVKLVTDDPEVVIYWIADKSGE